MVIVVEIKCVVFKRIAGQCPRASFNVVLGVATALAEREQFHQFARHILIGFGLLILVVVKIFNHGWIANDPVRQLREVARGELSKKLVLLVHVKAVFNGAVARGEMPMKEQRHFFLKRPRGLNHALDPPLLKFGDLLAILALFAVALALQCG